MSRILLFTGKGGVGKTTVAAATAVRAARHGRRVLLSSTDPAHSLADALDLPLGDRPAPVPLSGGDPGGSLHAQQIDAQQRLERHWHEVRDYLVELLAWGGVSGVQAEELVLLPGLEELFALIDLRHAVADRAHDLVVLDCAPTAETLRLLALPDALHWYVDRVMAPGRRVARALRPVVQRVGGVPVPEDGVFGAVERVQADLSAVRAMLADPDRSSVRLVVNPERMVLSEARRTATSLSLFGFGLDAVVVNRVLPPAVTDPYLATWRRRHAEHLERVQADFAPTPVLEAPLCEDEPIGVDSLERLGRILYPQGDETAVLHRQQPVTVEPDTDGYRLALALPFTSRDDVDLHRRGTDLHVRAGAAKRIVPLPAVLRRCDIAGARLHDGVLEVRFSAPAPAESATAGAAT